MEAHVGEGVIRGEVDPSLRDNIRGRLQGVGTRTRRLLKALVIGLLVQHWIFLETQEAFPSLVILTAALLPYSERLLPVLRHDLAFYSLVLAILIMSIPWWILSKRWQPEMGAHQRTTFSRIIAYMKPHWPYAVGVGVFIVATASLHLAPPWIIGFLLIERVIGRPDMAFLPWVVILLAGVYGARAITSYLKEVFAAQLGQRSIHALRSDAYQQIEALPVKFFDATRTGELVSRVVSDTNEVEKVLTDDLAKLVADVVMVGGALTVLFLIDARSTMLVAPVALLIIIAVNSFKRVIKRASRRIREAFAELTARGFEVLSGIRIVKSFRMEDYEAREFRTRSFEIARAKVRMARLSGVYGSTVDLLTAVMFLIVIWFATPVVVANMVTNPGAAGPLVAFILYLKELFKPLTQLSKANITIQKAVAAADRVFEVMDIGPEVREPSAGLSPATIHGRIQFDHVSFGYRPNQNVLQDFSLAIEAGETVAVVGSSGAGKSTVVNLLLRFYEPTVGKILIDEYPIDSLNLGFLRNKIGLVLQEPVLFSGTIRENIGFGSPTSSQEDIVQAAQLANAHEFIVALPKGYDTEIGERGVTLSVGQRQRIAIARALIKNPSILIFDEATSNIDSESEALIQEALARLAGRRTIIVIGHRLSSIMDADRIVVLQEGGIAEIGTHEALIGKGGTYTRLYEPQLDRGEPRYPFDDEMFEEEDASSQ